MKFIFLYFCIVIAVASKCPETKKAYPINCNVFYNCVNLPTGGYVWVPTKCAEGLVYEPYLRTCVLPGHSWTCHSLSPGQSLTIKRYDTPESSDLNQTSYVGSTQNSLEISEILESYTTENDNFEDEIVTSVPLFDFETEEKDDEHGISKIINHQAAEDNKNNSDSLLSRLINQFIVYKEIYIPLKLFVPLHVASSPTTRLPQLNAATEVPERNRQNVLMNYLIHNYIQQNNLRNTIITEVSTKISEDINETKAESITASTEAKPGILITDSEAENHIIVMNDNVGNKQYFTVERYKTLAHQLNPRFASLLPCIKNVRLPNVTDCFRYYTCDPQTAFVIEYSCPFNTGFNKYSRICDTESRKNCMENEPQNDKRQGSSTETKVPEKKICTEFGKIKDPTSDSHYYICYATSGVSADMKAMRMTCPNSLIFCQSKKVCSTKRLCKGT